MDSIWNDIKMPSYPALAQDIRTDVLIVGGGMAGLLCAHEMEKRGIDYVLVEAGRICGGVTGRTTAKITAQHGLLYHRLLKSLGQERAQMYLDANLAAVEDYRVLAKKIACDYEEKDSFVYLRDDRDLLEQELRALEELNYGAEFAVHLPLPFSTAGAVKFPRQAQFHPLKFAGSLAAGKHIFENTRVQELGKRGAKTEHGRIRAEKTIVCTHFPILNKHGGYFLKLYQERSYVLALKNAGDVGGMYVDGESGGLSLRNHGSLMLFGGAGGRTGTKCGGWAQLEEQAGRLFPHAEPVSRWATQDCISLDGSAYIGAYGKHTDSLYVAAGFNKWGMSSAMAASKILADLVEGKENPFAPAFDPHRSMAHPQLAANLWESTRNLLTPSTPRCPHLGCALKYNKAEHSWDCPCHGSRFSEEGKLLDNPATGDHKRIM